jgi:hypothetical protein
MPDINYPQKPYQGQSYGQNFNTGMAQQQAYAQQQEAWRKYYQQQQQMYGQIPQQAQMTPQQQRYGQQIQTAAREPEDYRAKINSRSRLAIIAIVTLFVLIFLGVLVYFMLPKQQEAIQGKAAVEEAPAAVTVGGQELLKSDVVIDEIKLCSDIDYDFNCIELEGNTLSAGDSVYLYTRITGFSQIKRDEGNLIGIRQDIETLDPEGITVYQLSGTAANIADFISEGQTYLHLKNRIKIPAELTEGAYTLKINVVDKITGKEASLEKGFWIE